MRDLPVDRPLDPVRRSGPVPALAAGGLCGLLLAWLALAAGLGWIVAFLAYGFGGSAAMLALAAAADRKRPASGRLRMQRVLHGG